MKIISDLTVRMTAQADKNKHLLSGGKLSPTRVED
jgi:hypothetical protein